MKGLNIYLRKDGRWEGRIAKGKDSNGKRSYHYFFAHTCDKVAIDIIIIAIMRHEIAPSIPCSVVGMIHFETSYMLRAVWVIAFIWGLLYLTMITILIGAAFLELISWKE